MVLLFNCYYNVRSLYQAAPHKIERGILVKFDESFFAKHFKHLIKFISN